MSCWRCIVLPPFISDDPLGGRTGIRLPPRLSPFTQPPAFPLLLAFPAQRKSFPDADGGAPQPHTKTFQTPPSQPERGSPPPFAPSPPNPTTRTPFLTSSVRSLRLRPIPSRPHNENTLKVEGHFSIFFCNLFVRLSLRVNRSSVTAGSRGVFFSV